jgi:predicted small secreted protein
MKKIFSGAIIFSAMSLLISGCNTVGGFGEDLQEGGQAISHVATKVSDGGETRHVRVRHVKTTKVRSSSSVTQVKTVTPEVTGTID